MIVGVGRVSVWWTCLVTRLHAAAVKREVVRRTVPALAPTPADLPPPGPVLGWVVIGELEVPVYELRLVTGRIVVRAQTSEFLPASVEDRLALRGEDGALVLVGGPKLVIPASLGGPTRVEVPIDASGIEGRDFAANYSWS